MKLSKIQTINSFLVLISFVEAIWAYGKLPEKVASHWNVQGQIDGYMSKFGGAFFLPFLILGLYLFFLVIPKIDPKKENVKKFIEVYRLFITVFLLFMFYLYTLTILVNLGYGIDFIRALMPGFAGFFYFMGWMLPKAEPNWFVGIRTPWTLSSEVVWRKTHQMGGKLFKLSGLLALAGLFLPKSAFLLVFIPVIASSIITVIYSYYIYKKT